MPAPAAAPPTSKPAPPKPAAPAAPPAAAPPAAAPPSGDSDKRKKIIIGISAAVLAAALAIPLLLKYCNDEEEDDCDRKVAQGPAVLNKLVSWVKEVNDDEEKEYTELANVVDYSNTESL